MTETIPQNVLLVGTETATTRALLEVLAAKGIRGTALADVHSGISRLPDRAWDLVVVALQPEAETAFQLLRAVKQDHPELPVVMIGQDGAAATVVRAMREGCEDFLVRPVSRQAVERLVDTLLPNHEVPLAAAGEADNRCLYQIVGKSGRFLDAIRAVGKVALSSAPVLITGESGTGKELIAYYLHHRSHRRRGPYVRVNCAALSESLLESELFGHERGAFTGAYSQRKGRFERAHGGTLLLDEISETGPRLQAELLRVLEQQDFERLGGTELIRVDVRVVSTTNRDLARQVERGRFRLDLYYRIGGLRLTVPPLRQRPDDIPLLVWHFVNQYAREARRRITELDPKMLDVFARCAWPGNVRQLRSVVRTALVLGAGPTLSLEGATGLEAELLAQQPAADNEPASLRLRELERQAIFEALRRTKRNQAKAARLLGITDRTLREKLRRYRRDGSMQEAGEGRWKRQPISSSC